MPENFLTLRKPAVAGLIGRVGKYSWFRGRGTPPSPSTGEPAATNNDERPPQPWSNVAEWLRRMHAQADRLPPENKEQ
ncbi:MAG TPA: hypothetical protein VKW06_14720 [Candidatus Angelobacter sp.]|nr:hypothetical protein [Candidatus Angelobacter sp.]